jgi:hypothetical protein
MSPPPYPGHAKRSKRPARAPPTLSHEQQTTAKRVKAVKQGRSEEKQRVARQPLVGLGVKYGGKKLTPQQERLMYEKYADRCKPRSDSAESEELMQVLIELGVGVDTCSNSSCVDSKVPAPGDVSLQHIAKSDGAPTESPIFTEGFPNTDQKRTEDQPKTDQALVPDLSTATTSVSMEDSAIAEVLAQLDEEDELASHGDCNGAKGNRYVSFRCGVEEAMSWALGQDTWNYKQN